jgi:hypothetical protein
MPSHLQVLLPKVVRLRQHKELLCLLHQPRLDAVNTRGLLRVRCCGQLAEVRAQPLKAVVALGRQLSTCV